MRTIAVALCLVLFVSACGDDDSGSDATSAEATETVANETVAPTPSTQDGEATGSGPTEARPDNSTDSPAQGAEDSGAPAEAVELYPDVIDATAAPDGDGTWNFSATLSSPYDSPQRYADAWRVLGSDGSELGVRILGHDHANEQPFTRSLGGVEVPADITVVTIEGRDQISGWGGTTFDLTLPR